MPNDERLACRKERPRQYRNRAPLIANAAITLAFVLLAFSANAQTSCASWGPAIQNMNNTIAQVRTAIAAREREARTLSAESALHTLDMFTTGTPASSLRMACGFNPSTCESPKQLYKTMQDRVRSMEQEIAQSRRNLASLERDRDRMQTQQQRDCAREAARNNAAAQSRIAPPPPPPAGPIIDTATATAIIGIMGGVAGAIGPRGGGFPASPGPRCHHRPGASTQHCQ